MPETATPSSAMPLDAPNLSVGASAFRLRGGLWFAAGVWVSWILLSVLLTWSAFRFHLRHFEPQSLLLLTGAAVVGSVAVHLLLRRHAIRQVTLPLLAASVVAACVVFEPWALIVTAAGFVACYGLGRFLRERFGLVVGPGSQEIALSAGLGLALSILALFWLGLAHLYRAPVFLALLLGACIAFRREIKGLWTSCRGLQGTLTAVLAKKDTTVSIAIVFGVAQVLLGLIVVLTPALDADFISFHFPLVRFYAAQHALTPLPTLDYTYYPQGVEMLMTFGHVLAGQAAARMIPQIFFVVLLLLIPTVAHELGLSRRAAVLAIVFVAALPFLHRTAVFAKNDPALAFFQLSALLCYFRSRSDTDGHWLRLGAVFLAASFAVKHVALFGAIPIGILYLWRLRRHPRPVREIAILAGLFAVVALPWHVRTFVHTGSPVYPAAVNYATSVLGSGESAPAGRAEFGYLRIPVEVLFRGGRFFESVSRNPLGILFVLLLGIWLVVRRRVSSPVERACLLFCLAYYLYWGAIWPVVRYAIVPFLLLATMMSGRLVALRDRAGGMSRLVSSSAWAYGLFFALLVTLILEIKPGMIGYLTGTLTESRYIALNDPRYESLHFLAENAEPDDLIFSVRNLAAGFAPNPGRFHASQAMTSASISNTLLTDLRKRSYRFLILPSSTSVDESVKATSAQYELALVHRDRAFRVFRLGPP